MAVSFFFNELRINSSTHIFVNFREEIAKVYGDVVATIGKSLDVLQSNSDTSFYQRLSAIFG